MCCYSLEQTPNREFAMSVLKAIFGRKVKDSLDTDQYDLPEGFAEKFYAYRDALRQTGAEMPDSYSKDTPYLCAFDRAHNSEAKKWVTTTAKTLHIRYYDKNISKNSGLAVLDLDIEQQCYRFQKTHEYKIPEEALTDFTIALAQYADAKFMRVLLEKLDACEVLDLEPYLSNKAKADSPESEVVKTERKEPEPLIS